MGPLFTGDGPVPLHVELDSRQQQLVAKAIGDTPPAEWLQGVILRAATWQVAVRELREADPRLHDWTPQNLPPALTALHDAPGGTSLIGLAGIINAYDRLLIYDDTDGEAHDQIWHGHLSTNEYVDLAARQP